MPKRIVIAVDTKDRTLDALALGRVLAGATGAPSSVVTVFPFAPLDDTEAPELVEARDDARRVLSELADVAGPPGADVEVIAGNFAARELQHVSEREDTGLLVVGSTHRGPVGRLLVGGVGERLLAGAACPIAIAPRGYADAAPSRLATVGVGVDGSAEARDALEAAVTLARGPGATVRVITAFQPIAFGDQRVGALAAPTANDVLRTELLASHEEAIRTASEAVEAEGRFHDGTAGDVLLEESADLDLLVVGSRGYGPLRAVLAGSVATALARAAACPVLVTPRDTRLRVT